MINLFSIPRPSLIVQFIILSGYVFLILFGFFWEVDIYRLSQICQHVLFATIFIHILEASYSYRLANASTEKEKALVWSFWTLLYGFLIVQLLKKKLNLS